MAQGRTTTATFVYEGFGRRMNKTISGTTTQFLYDRLNPVQELSSANGVVANLMTGLRIDEYFTLTASGATSTFLSDALGSTIGLVSANNGPIATNYTYQPFGATTVNGSANSNSFEFTGPDRLDRNCALTCVLRQRLKWLSLEHSSVIGSSCQPPLVNRR